MISSVKIFSGTASRQLSEKIAKSYGKSLGKEIIERFADGEIEPSYEETLRGY